MRRCLNCEATFVADAWSCPACGAEPEYIDGFPAFSPQVAQDNSDYDPNYFRLLVTIEEDSFWFAARNRVILWALVRFFPRIRSAIEIGVGTGFVMRAMRAAYPEARFWGSDIHIEGLQFAAQRLGTSVDLLQMDARRIPFREEFDVVCLFDVLEHIEEDEAVLREAGRALRPGGGLILTVPQHMFLWGPADNAAYHKRRYGIRELARKAQAAGFEVLLKTSFIAVLLPFLYASRLRSRWSGRYDLSEEGRMPSLVDQSLRGLLSVELALIRLGLHFPVGGSQLLVAVRK